MALRERHQSADEAPKVLPADPEATGRCEPGRHAKRPGDARRQGGNGPEREADSIEEVETDRSNEKNHQSTEKRPPMSGLFLRLDGCGGHTKCVTVSYAWRVVFAVAFLDKDKVKILLNLILD